jgi:hypothetical protein
MVSGLGRIDIAITIPRIPRPMADTAPASIGVVRVKDEVGAGDRPDGRRCGLRLLANGGVRGVGPSLPAELDGHLDVAVRLLARRYSSRHENLSREGPGLVLERRRECRRIHGADHGSSARLRNLSQRIETGPGLLQGDDVDLRAGGLDSGEDVRERGPGRVPAVGEHEHVPAPELAGQ